jgi:hypothetical protein
MNNTMSTLGVLSVNPVSNANRLGMVAACKQIAANHPSVSADIAEKCETKNSVTCCLTSSKSILVFIFAFWVS